MARFDYHHVGGRLLVDCQSDTLSDLTTRVVAPLFPSERVPSDLKRLHPIIEIDGTKLVLAAHLLTAMPVKALGPVQGSVAEHEYQIIAALDFLLTGV
jgi:toxin CcdB